MVGTDETLSTEVHVGFSRKLVERMACTELNDEDDAEGLDWFTRLHTFIPPPLPPIPGTLLLTNPKFLFPRLKSTHSVSSHFSVRISVSKDSPSVAVVGVTTAGRHQPGNTSTHFHPSNRVSMGKEQDPQKLKKIAASLVIVDSSAQKVKNNMPNLSAISAGRNRGPK
ncbi:hypothetical protein L1987_59298 [Smallanthus sonchifolius]|uniref:Uncharacterized protein n=1 Tax=Smallanthus sonchifolius TaxID=185202 RepID=A0ACB9D4U3_9ASTR|nr:hypothetical protein L1987_59298 [Smallanthus sonchifolius]